jgi:hypothetical protein
VKEKTFSSSLMKGCFVYVGLFVLGCCVVWLGNCLWSLQPPKVPIYPGSELNAQTLNEGYISILTTYYSVPASPEEIYRFYKERGATCWEPDTSSDSGKMWQRCEGKRRLHDQYFVYIDIDSYSIDGTTSYRLEIWWRKCSLKLSL